jgi:hypothetical protein
VFERKVTGWLRDGDGLPKNLFLQVILAGPSKWQDLASSCKMVVLAGSSKNDLQDLARSYKLKLNLIAHIYSHNTPLMGHYFYSLIPLSDFPGLLAFQIKILIGLLLAAHMDQLAIRPRWATNSSPW